MIGYYVHHHGRGHLHRALAVAAALDEPVTFLSSLPPYPQARPWVALPRDDEGVHPRDPTARGTLHWAPLGDDGLRGRMREISTWIDDARPRAMVVDVSVEVAVHVRLHGVPVVEVVLPGRRTDPAHLLGFAVADALVGCWPTTATPGMLPDLSSDIRRRVQAVGGLARHRTHDAGERRPGERRPGKRRVALLAGAGGSAITQHDVARAVRSTPEWDWTVVGPPGEWHDDPEQVLRDADVVVTHAGQNAVAEVAAARRPAVLVPQSRPFDEQAVAAAALEAGGWPVVVAPHFPQTGWTDLLELACTDRDGRDWTTWCDGAAAERFADVVAGVGR